MFVSSPALLGPAFTFTREYKMELVAVYGSLREGCHNHHYLARSEKVETIVVSGIKMFDNRGSYPYATRTENEADKMLCDVYKVDAQTFARLDMLEGISRNNDENGHYFRRKINGNGPWIYTTALDNTLGAPEVPTMAQMADAGIELDESCPTGDITSWPDYLQYRRAWIMRNNPNAVMRDSDYYRDNVNEDDAKMLHARSAPQVPFDVWKGQLFEYLADLDHTDDELFAMYGIRMKSSEPAEVPKIRPRFAEGDADDEEKLVAFVEAKYPDVKAEYEAMDLDNLLRLLQRAQAEDESEEKIVMLAAAASRKLDRNVGKAAITESSKRSDILSALFEANRDEGAGAAAVLVAMLADGHSDRTLVQMLHS